MRSVITTCLVIFLIVVALFVWVTQVNPVFAVGSYSAAANTTGTASATSAPLSFSLNSLTAESIANERATTPAFDGDGVVFIDTADGTPQTPYLAYETTNHTLDIKELVFLNNNQEPCQVSAGELPCVPDSKGNGGAASDQSPVPSGTAVHIEGGVDDQGIVVQSISKVSAVPANMVRFATTLGGTTTLSNGVSILPLQIFTDASCTVGVGCYGNGVNRVETTISIGNSQTTTELVPGTLFIYGNSTVILLSVAGSGTSAIVNFLVGTH
jgi:hypothetical protein